MIKIHTKDITPFLYKFRVLFLLVVFSFISIILGGMFLGIIPTIFIFIYLLVEKYVLQLDILKEYTTLDILVTALLYGFAVGVILYILIFLVR